MSDDRREAPRRVVFTGSECTGKTTTAARLAEEFGAAFVPEFVREFAEAKGGTIAFEDHGPIARGQQAAEDRAIADATIRRLPLVVQDTDLLSTAVYCQHYFGACPPWIAELAQSRRPDLYLLMDVDLPWIADGVRDRGDRRTEMQALFQAAVAASGARFVQVQGIGSERVERARAAIKELL
jgi:NadR type nicotinamide-nucleotide adenylyltransferase